MSHSPPGCPTPDAWTQAVIADFAIGELTHYREVGKWIHSRGLQTAADAKDQYVLALRTSIRKESEAYLLDIEAGIIKDLPIQAALH